ncbi:uncharacterized protein N7443_007882 [Penicillium atrosanguineum]|uniref:uncharacterized protein n=1 Tax=Penicillium atrosanguineum TaxID=1132637 RepID=UPI00239F535C|nr:uncharacterized protein N7443_007882 [Penicillium atrosanguineum]KAJ5296989.1 hypothetical protein N7443_007882 [Penicillium atrosanguineum]
MLSRRFSRRFAAVAAAIGLLCLYYLVSLQSNLPQRRSRPSADADANIQYAGEPSTGCPPLPGIEDILVVMKTGVTEARQKVPIHFKTTLSCIPHYVIYSDFEEEIEGVKIYDALSTIDSGVKMRVQDFDIYNRIAGKGRKGLEQEDFADEDNTNFGKPNNPGWKLDKWKFLPMAQEALKYKPDAKWFVFMEADTYPSWPTLLTWLAKFDHKKPYYLGTETQIADVIFAHGGSGFMLSNPALTKASEQYESRRAELDDYTDGHWAGDCVLGKVLADAGVNLHFTWPILQNSNLGELEEFTTELYRQPWCYIAVALHHLKAEEIEDLWKYEQKRWHEKNKHLLLHSDLFREFIYPEMAISPTRLNWDNLSGEEQPFATSFEDCREICDVQKTCVQFSFRDNTCFTSSSPRLGSSHREAASGWLTSRIRKMMDKKGLCRAPEFGDTS